MNAYSDKRIALSFRGFQIYVISGCHLRISSRDDRRDEMALKSPAKKDDTVEMDHIAQMAVATRFAGVISALMPKKRRIDCRYPSCDCNYYAGRDVDGIN